MNRRGILGLFAAAPIAGKAVAEGALASLSDPIPSGMRAMQEAKDYAINPAPKEMAQLVPRSQALRMILGNAQALAEIRDELFEQQRNVVNVDPDILVMKSWSPMAKITFQRQRNVERALADLFAPGDQNRPSNFYSAVLHRWMDKFLWGGDRA